MCFLSAQLSRMRSREERVVMQTGLSIAVHMSFDIHIIGGGLAGSEAAWQLAEAGIKVRLSEMRGGGDMTPAHQTDRLAEMVCSNSFRSDDAEHNAVGLLHAEMRALGSLIMARRDKHRVPAGSALAVDRDGCSAAVTDALIERIPRSNSCASGSTPCPTGPTIIATGPLTAAALPKSSAPRPGTTPSPSSTRSRRSSIATASTWTSPGWQRAGTRARARITSTARSTRSSITPSTRGCSTAKRPSSSEWEKDTPYFEGCMPIEVMAERGLDTLRYGPMKPVGLDDPRTGRWPYAVVQLRQDNALGTLWNMVGFQTKLKHAEQVRLFRTIPGLENAEFARLGGLHRNTFINSPAAARRDAAPEVDAQHPLRRPDHRLRGLCRKRGDRPARRAASPQPSCAVRRWPPPPAETALGALLAHITGGADAETLPADERQFRAVAADRRSAPRKPTARRSILTAHELRSACELQGIRLLEPA